MNKNQAGIFFILEYRKLDDFRYSALGFGEFCEIPQGVTVTQQASGLLRNARGVKPLWKISALALILIAAVFVGCSSLNIHEDYEDIKLDNKYFIADVINIVYRKNPKGVSRNARNEENTGLIIDTLIKTNQKRYNFTFQHSDHYISLDHNILDVVFRALERLDVEKCRVPDNIIESFWRIEEDYILIIRHIGIYVAYGEIDDEEDLTSAATELLRGVPFWRDGSEHIKSCFEYLLFDKNTKKIILYNKNVIIEDPRSRKVLEFQVNDLFEDLKEL